MKPSGIVDQLREQRWVRGKGRIGRNEKGQPVGRRPLDGLRADARVAARAIFDDDRLAPHLLQTLANDAGHDVCDAAGWNWDDQLNGATRIILRRRGCRERSDRDAHRHSYEAEHL